MKTLIQTDDACFLHHDDIIEGGGAGWIFCLCGQWLRKDCVEDVVQDQDKNQLVLY